MQQIIIFNIILNKISKSNKPINNLFISNFFSILLILLLSSSLSLFKLFIFSNDVLLLFISFSNFCFISFNLLSFSSILFFFSIFKLLILSNNSLFLLFNSSILLFNSCISLLNLFLISNNSNFC